MTDETKPKSPWAQAAERGDLTEEERKMLEAVDEKLAGHPPAFEPADWNKLSREEARKMQEVNCAIQHLFHLAGFSDQQQLTYFAEKLGSIIGDQAKTPESITSTVAVFTKPIMDAAKAYYTNRKTQETLQKLFGDAFTDKKGMH